MNGPEHYREAQRLLSQASHEDIAGNPVSHEGRPIRPETHAALIARANVHAQLAAVAAHVTSQPIESTSGTGGGIPDEDWDDWLAAFHPDYKPNAEEN